MTKYPSIVLKELITFSKDGEWGAGEPSEDSIPMAVIRGTDFEDTRIGKLDSLPIRHIAKHIAERKQIQANDIILETAGGSKDRPTGRTLFITENIVSSAEFPLICASFSRLIRLDDTLVCPNYIFWALQYLYSQGYMLRYHTQHTGVARFQWTVFSENEPIPVPPLEIQHRIAAILSAYDDLIENNTRRISDLEAAAQALYREWFVEFRFPGHESAEWVESELGVIPAGWEAVSIINIMNIQGGSQPPKDTFIYEPKNGYVRLIQIRDYQTDAHQTFVKESKNLRFCKRDDVMIARYGASVARICRGLEGAYNVALAKVLPKSEYLREFLRNYLLSEETQARIIGFSGRTAQAGFNKSDLESIKLAFPASSTLLIDFDAYTRPMLEEVLLLEDKNKLLREARDHLLPRLISGELEVNEMLSSAIFMGE